MKGNILTYLLLITISASNLSYSISNNFDNEYYNFKKLGLAQGLSQSSIIDLTQDNRGYMWFCTATGLNRYDGYEFVVYVNNTNDSLSLSDNEIKSIFKDRDGFLWIGTSNGMLDKFDTKTETFSHYDIANSSDWFSLSEESFYDYSMLFSRNQNSSITSITQDSYGNLWIGTWGKGIVKFNPKTKKKKYYYHFKNKKNSLSSNRIVKIIADSDDVIWVGTFGGGLNSIKQFSGYADSISVTRYETDSGHLFGNKIRGILEDSNKNIWIGSFGEGLFLIDNNQKGKKPENINYEKIILSSSQKNNLNVMSLVEDNKSTIWISTFGDGLYNYLPKSKTSYQFLTNANNPNSLSSNETTALFVDQSGVLWIGTQLGSGINKLELRSPKFNNVPVLLGEGKSLNDNIVWAVLEDSESNIWFGTYRGGLNKWNRKTNKYTYFLEGGKFTDNHIRALIEDTWGNIWIGAYSGGLSFYNKQKDEFTKFSKEISNKNGINSNQIQSLYIEGDSVLWIGTFGGGLNKLNLNKFYKTGDALFINYIHNPVDLTSISDDRVYKIYQSSDKTFWIGTLGGGLNKFDKETETFKYYKASTKNNNSLSDNEVMVIQETKDGLLLIGTFGGGIDVFDPENNSFFNLNNKIAMTCSDIYGILPDDNDGYWLSTNDGIYKVNEDLSSFRKYDLMDGLQSLEFCGGAYFKTKDGTCYFGGINGVNYFKSKNFKPNTYLAPIVISRIKVFDKIIKGDKENLVFGKDENYFSFEFASLDFENSGKNKYKYILEGLDSKWSYTEADNRRVFYNNLTPGEYTFKVSGTNHDGIWSPNKASVAITILAPFWMQWWFIIGIILLIIGLIIFFILQRFKYLFELDSLKSNIAADLHDNVGAGLTEISILSELASTVINDPNKATKHISQISELSRELVESMSDIVWVVNPKRDSLYDLIVRLKDSYGELLSDMGITLKTSNLDKLNTIKLSLEYRQNLYLIFKESINNCIKHSKCSKINLDIKLIKNNIKIELMDNGISFDIQNVKHGNGLINIKSRAKNIGGLLTINSNNSGTIIKFEGKVK